MTPRSTLRLQLHKGFTFADAENIVPYLARLGISHLYTSPIAMARPGSTHGYDGIDPSRINPELGGEAGFERLAGTAQRQGLGIIIDIVPNHMAASLDNPWWLDVLTHGRNSRYANAFDIDWESDDPLLRGKVLLPLLTQPLSDALSSAAMEIVTHPDGSRGLRYGTTILPLQGDGALSMALLERQPYRLAWWRTAGDRINWRRFFDINELVCLRMEDSETFERVHALPALLYAQGMIDGVRVDHVDGLADPADYCCRLRQRLDAGDPSRPYIVVEKILMRGELLPGSWRCDGTTGYDFMDQVSALQHDAAGEAILKDAWAALSHRPRDFDAEEEIARRETIARSFAAPLEACVAAFERAAAGMTDLTRPSLRRVLELLLINFPVYRSYGTPEDGPALDAAFAGARRSVLPNDAITLAILERWFREPGPEIAPLRRFQQLSAPIAAKAVEDTAFYRYGPLLSRNDVGFDVRQFSLSPDDFHRHMMQCQPTSLLATATHDHKRGEDVRARLAVLSERATEWTRLLARWIAALESLRRNGIPSAGDVAMLLQIVVGAWPLDLALDDAAGRIAFAHRLAAWQEKALREAKLASDWSAPNEPYEAAARSLVLHLVGDAHPSPLLEEIFAFVQSIAPAGAVNSLAQVLIKLTAPGVPDFYQGTEHWDFSLVDPDNRRPVDYAVRIRSIEEGPTSPWRSGALKQNLIVRTLSLRAAWPDPFVHGTYEPVRLDGDGPETALAFCRRQGRDLIMAVVPRLPGRLHIDGASSRLEITWPNLRLDPPSSRIFFDVLQDYQPFEPHSGTTLKELCGRRPLALFSTRNSPHS
ncbi:MAG: malto-oligosyltrehalose synthase [Reyranella sp.]|uniref:malto-oligosyltrehalose synthase n=1 Tax=Reyranella sp. TaxID=1929291 RepID=UPI003D0E9F7E